MDHPEINETNCPNREECEEFCECQKQKYLGILRRIAEALDLRYSPSDYDPEDYERRIIAAIYELKYYIP